MSTEIINERSQLLLKTLIERYIRSGEPVGSKTLLQEARLPISSATVRNVLADLEDKGFLVSPHTSAGRVPTQLGYRFFVDSLLSVKPLDQQAIADMQAELDSDKSAQQLVSSASSLLSTITAQVGLVTVPKRDRQSLRQVEFLPLSGNRVLVILVINNKEVQNRIIYTEREFTEIELQQASNLINQRFAGRNLGEVRQGILAAMESDRESIDRHMRTTLDIARQVFTDEGEEDATEYVLAGESRLINYATAGDMDKLQELFSAFERKKDILALVDRCLAADGVQIFIGEEAGYEVFGDFSVVTSPYQASGETIGVLGVIGPTRMAYEKVIPMVDVTARMLTLAMSKG